MQEGRPRQLSQHRDIGCATVTPRSSPAVAPTNVSKAAQLTNCGGKGTGGGEAGGGGGNCGGAGGPSKL